MGEARWRLRRFSSREACEGCDCECRSDDAPPLPITPCEKDCCECDIGCDRCCDPAATAAAEEPASPAPPLPPVLLKSSETQDEADRMCQNNGSSRGERVRNWRVGISPGREDGDGAEVARLVDLKLHGLLPGAGWSEEAAAAVVIAGARRAAEQ